MIRQDRLPLAGYRRTLRRVRRFAPFYWMLALPVFWFLLFRYVPMYGVTIAFKEFAIRKGILDSPWATPPLKHFTYFFHSRYFTQLLGNTLILSAMKLSAGMLASILLALLLNECRSLRLKRAVQTLTYMPHFLSWVILYGITLLFLSQDTGILNLLLARMGLKKVAFLSSPALFRWVLLGTDLWKDCGWGAIIYLAAMAGIDPTLYEAARIDGAGRLQQIRHVTLPAIRGVIVVMLILKLGNILDAGFDQVFVFYNIQVMSVSDILDTWVYRTGLEQLNFSLGSAVGLFKSLIGSVLILASNTIARRLGGNGLW